MYSMTKTDFLASEERKEILKSDRKLERVRTKRAQVDLWLSRAQELVEGYEYKEFVLLGDWDETTGERNFRNALSNETIGRLLRYPSQCNEDKVKEQVAYAKEAYDLLFSHGFGTNNPADFLAFLGDSEDPAMQVLLQYRDSFGVEWVERDRFHRIYGTLRFVQTLRERGPLAAFLPHVRNKMKDVFVRAHIPLNGTTRWKTLAGKVWDLHNPGWNSGPRTPAEWKNSYEICGREYALLRSRLKKYMNVSSRLMWIYQVTAFVLSITHSICSSCPLQRKECLAFMAETSVPASRGNFLGGTTRRSTMDRYFFELRHGSRELLKAEKYEELLALHKVLFLNPHM